MKKIALLLTLVAGLCVMGSSADAAGLCGGVITSNKTLHRNVHCTGQGITIGANNVVLNLNGFTLSGAGASGSIGVQATDVTGITVRNGVIKNFENGVVFDTVSASFVRSVRSIRNGHDGLILRNTTDTVLVAGSAFSHNITDGIDIVGSNNNTVRGSSGAVNIRHGIHIEGSSSGNQITSDHFTGNTGDGLFAESSTVGDTVNAVVANKNIGDGINVQANENTSSIANSTANFNEDNGMEAAANVQDGGNNHARGNGGVFQCENPPISC